MLRPLIEAAAHTRRFPTLGLIVLVSVAPGAVGLSYTFLLPVVIRDLGADPGAIGLLYVGGGIGGLLAGLAAEPLMRRVGHGRTIFVGMGLIGAGLIGVGLSGALGLAAVATGVAQAWLRDLRLVEPVAGAVALPDRACAVASPPCSRCSTGA